jgi:hypothetical protein
VELKVSVKISPPPSQVDKKEVDKLLEGEIAQFEQHVIRQAKERGFEGAPLASFERGMVKAYLFFAATERAKDADE